MRFYFTDERIRILVEKLVKLYILHGSVNQICKELNKFSTDKIYPNRIHSLLSNKSNLSFNEKTIRSIETAIAKVTIPEITQDIPDDSPPAVVAYLEEPSLKELLQQLSILIIKIQEKL